MIFELIVAAALAVEGPTAQLEIPEQYQGDRVSEVLFVHPSEITKYCGEPAPGLVRFACAEVNGNRIVLPNPCFLKDHEFYAKLACHEMAHNNGWNHKN